MELDTEYFLNKLVELGKTNNLRINGIKENDGKSWWDCEAEVQKFFIEKLDNETKISLKKPIEQKE